MKSAVRTLDDLGIDLVLAPERHLVPTLGEGVPLGELAVERTERASPKDLDGAIVLDTTHARDGVLDISGALRDRAGDAKSTKKLARAGDLVVSRLRPYLRQIAYVHPRALAVVPDTETLALSSEFYVLTPTKGGDDLAFLLPFLLGEAAQRALAAAQEGGHHPRVPRASLFALRIPHAVVRARKETSRKVKDALAAYYGANARLAELIRP